MKKSIIYFTAICLSITFMISSCTKPEDELENLELEKTFSFNADAFVIYDFEELKASVNPDSSYTMQNQEGFFNNVGGGFDLSNETYRNSIFTREPSFHNLIELKVDEALTAKIIVACNPKLHQYLLDSCMAAFYGNTSSVRTSFSSIHYDHHDLNIIYYSILYLKQFGYAEMDLEDPEIYNYTGHKSSAEGLKYTDGTIMGKDNFRNSYGDVFLSKIFLGQGLVYSSEFYIKESLNATNEDLLLELIDLIVSAKEDKTDWNQLVGNSNYLKDYDELLPAYQTTPVGTNSVFNINDVFSTIDEFNQFYDDYKFGLLSWYLEPYSTIFPDYD